jgi:DHA2 family lincomycin resistance protein-like MFS transporter
MAMVTAVPAIAPALGPSVSGLVLSHLDWRWLFILVLPAALFALLLGTLKLPNDSQREDVAIDLLSIAFSAIGFGGLVYGLATIGESAEGSSPVHPIMPLTLGLVGITAFVVRQVILRRSGNALVDMAVFRTRLFVVGLSVMVFVAMNGFGTLLIFPLVLSDALGLNTLLIGLFLAPGGILITLVAALGGRVYDRRGPRPLVIPGALVWVAVLSYLATLDQHTSVWVYFATYLVMCTAQATMWAPMTTLALSSLTPDLYPHGSAAFTTVQQLSGAAGGAILISAYTLGVKSADEGSTVGSVITGGQWAFTSAAVLSVGAVIGVAAIGRVRTTGVQNE